MILVIASDYDAAWIGCIGKKRYEDKEAAGKAFQIFPGTTTIKSCTFQLQGWNKKMLETKITDAHALCCPSICVSKVNLERI
jgi:hypothetical protein